MPREKLNHEQFKMHLPQDVVADLDRKARSYNYSSAQEVVKKLISDYLSFWEQVEIVRQRQLGEQFKSQAKELEDGDIKVEERHPTKAKPKPLSARKPTQRVKPKKGQK